MFFPNIPGYKEVNPTLIYHSYLGVTSLALVLFQVLMGLLRPDKENKTFRPIFNYAHQFINICLKIFTNYCIVTGLYMIYLNNWTWVGIFYLVFLGLDSIIALGAQVYVQATPGYVTKGQYWIYFGFVVLCSFVVVVGLLVNEDYQ